MQNFELFEAVIDATDKFQKRKQQTLLNKEYQSYNEKMDAASVIKKYLSDMIIINRNLKNSLKKFDLMIRPLTVGYHSDNFLVILSDVIDKYEFLTKQNQDLLLTFLNENYDQLSDLVNTFYERVYEMKDQILKNSNLKNKQQILNDSGIEAFLSFVALSMASIEDVMNDQDNI